MKNLAFITLPFFYIGVGAQTLVGTYKSSTAIDEETKTFTFSNGEFSEKIERDMGVQSMAKVSMPFQITN